MANFDDDDHNNGYMSQAFISRPYIVGAKTEVDGKIHNPQRYMGGKPYEYYDEVGMKQEVFDTWESSRNTHKAWDNLPNFSSSGVTPHVYSGSSRTSSGPSVAPFYCKPGEKTENSFLRAGMAITLVAGSFSAGFFLGQHTVQLLASSLPAWVGTGAGLAAGAWATKKIWKKAKKLYKLAPNRWEARGTVAVAFILASCFVHDYGHLLYPPIDATGKKVFPTQNNGAVFEERTDFVPHKKSLSTPKPKGLETKKLSGSSQTNLKFNP